MRLFVAVDLGDAITGAVDRAAARLVELAPEAKWLAAPAMHVTLVFLGEIGEDRAPPISEAIRGVAARHASFELSVEGGGTFGPPLRPRVLWLGLGGEVAALAALQAELARCLRPLGYEPEHRAFSPHLTLARARGRAGDPALDRCASALKELRLGPARVGELVLYRSELTPGGSKYTPILRAPLACSRACSASPPGSDSRSAGSRDSAWGGSAGTHHPQVCPLFRSSSHFASGAK